MNLLIGSLTIGFILSLLALGIYISFRIFRSADLTAEGSITLGASLAAVLLVNGVHPVWATIAGGIGGLFAGLATGLLQTRLRIHQLLSGILVMTALYSVNLHVMGRSNIPLMSGNTLATMSERIGINLAGGSSTIQVLGWNVHVREAAMLVMSALICLAACIAIYAFFRTNIGVAMRATGDNPDMIRALGVDTGKMIVLGLCISNGLVSFSGAILAQYQGFADVQMGIGMLVWGLASVIIGGALVRTHSLGLTIAGTIMGSVLFRLLVAIALRWGLNPNDLKLVTAAFVLAALVMPDLLARMRNKRQDDHGDA